MKKPKIVFVMLAILLCITVVSTLLTLSVDAARDPLPGKDGSWAFVCCGACEGGQDYCVGTGTFICCK